MPRGPRNLRIEFGATGLTHYGGGVLVASIPLQNWIQGCGCTRTAVGAAQQSLQCGRDASRSAVPDGARSRTNRDYSTVAPQRRVPVFDWTAKLSGCHQ